MFGPRWKTNGLIWEAIKRIDFSHFDFLLILSDALENSSKRVVGGHIYPLSAHSGIDPYLSAMLMHETHYLALYSTVS